MHSTRNERLVKYFMFLETPLDLNILSASGSATTNPPAICTYEAQGALWVNRKVFVHPRFEVSLSVAINDKACNDRASWATDGWAMILSQTNNYLNGGGGTLGYLNINNALVTEFDLYQNSEYSDIDSNTVSIHKCIGSACSPNENSNTIQRLLVPSYSRCTNMQYDIRLIYNNGDFQITVGNTQIITMSENLDTDFGGWAYLGFTGFIRGSLRKFDITGSSICEDTYNPQKFLYNWMLGSTIVNQSPITFQAASTVFFTFAFVDSQGLVLPHFYNSQVWPYTVSFSTNCGVVNSKTLTVVDRMYLRLSISGCNVAGNYALTNTANLGTAVMPYSVVGSTFSNLKFLGYNGNNSTESSATRIDASKNMYFNLGSLGGDFSVDDFRSTVSLDFASTDIYGNFVTLGLDPNTAKAQMAIAISNNGTIISYSTSVVTQGIYRISFTIVNPGTYRIISSMFMNNYNRYYMTIMPGKPSTTYTSCTIVNSSNSPALDGNTIAAYSCSIRDSKNNVLTPAYLSQTYGLETTCTLKRVSLFIFTSTVASKILNGDNCICSALPTLQGSYTFIVNIGSDFTAPPIINQFTVIPGNSQISSSLVYDYSNSNFKTLSNYQTNITYVLGTTTLTLLDFTDSEGTPFSQFGYNSGFNPSNIVGSIIDTHNPSYSSPVRVAFSTMNKKVYVGVFLDNAVTFMQRNSFQYQLTLTLDTISIYININYPMGPTYNNLKACTHSLSAQKTQWIPTTSSPVSFLANTVAPLGNFLLQTQDNYIYNYKLPDISVIKASVIPNLPGTSAVIKEQGSYDGLYSLSFQAVTATNYNVTVSFNNIVILNNYIVSYSPVPIANKISPSPLNKLFTATTTPNLFNSSVAFTADAPVKIYFNALDQYNNFINVNPTSSNNYIGGQISLAIQGASQNVNMDNKTVNWSYDPIQNSYFVIDYYTTIGTHLITINSIIPSNSMTLSYQVLPGNYNPALSTGTLTSSKTLKVNQYATISILLSDSAGNNLANQPSLTNIIPNIIVSAIASDNTISPVNFVDVSQNLFRFTTNQLTKVSNYNFAISYNNSITNSITSIPCPTCSFSVVYDEFDITKCKLSAILSTNTILSTNSTLQINNALQNPLFNFNFFDSNGLPLQYVNPNSNIVAVLSGPNLQLNFFSQFVSTNQILFTLPSNVNIKDIVGGNYNISIFYNYIVAQIYPVQMTGDGQDSDAGNGAPNFNLTYFYSTVLNTVAANDVSFNIEFRTNQNLRVNQIGDLSKFSFNNSKNYTSPAFNVKVLNGAKKGQYIITINSIIASYLNDPIIITILYNNSIISQMVNLIVRSTALNNIVISPSSIVPNLPNQLNNGITVNPYSIVMSPYDKYGNIFQDVFNSTLYSPLKIAALFNIQYQDNSQINVTATADPTSQTISINVITRKTGTVNLNSFFLSQPWQWNVNPGPLSANYTFGTITNPSATIIAGNNATFQIFPRDNYNNIISLAQLSVSDYNLLSLSITQPASQNNLSPLYKTQNAADRSILFTVPLYQFGNNYFIPALTSGPILSCTSCQLQVNLAPVNFAYSILNNGTSLMSQSNLNNLTIGVYPTFALQLNDNFNNTYNYIPSDFNYVIQFQGNQANVAFCSSIQNNLINIFVCTDNANIKRWASLVSSSAYYLTITNNNNRLSYPINLSGSGNDSDASNAPLDVSLTNFSTNNITTVAGQVAQFMIELRGTDNKRINYWYDNPSSNITVSFTNPNSVYTSTISLGPKYGQYFISVSSQKSFQPPNSNNSIYLTIAGITCTSQVVFFVTPATASSAFVVDSNNNKIPYGNLSSGNADTPYSQKLVFYDIYQNVAPATVGSVNLLISPPSNKNGVQIQSNMILNADNSITLTIDSIYSGTYTIQSNYFNNQYTFYVNAGDFSAINSLAVVPSSATAGDPINFYIIPFDANKNYIDPTSRTNKFNVSYNYKDPITLSLVQNIPINSFQVGSYPNSDIASCSNCNAYAYTIQTKYRDLNNFAFTLNSASVTCINCVTKVSPATLAFSNSLLMRFNVSSGGFNQFTDNPVEDNSKVDIQYRIYARDIYSNSINSMSTPSNYTLVLTDASGVNYNLYNNIYNSTSQQYIEFLKNDNSNVNGDLTYNTLVGGIYRATFFNGIQNITTNITLVGRPSDVDASNQKINVQNTVITGMNLAFIAGQSGYLIIELKTIDNMRKNNWNQQVSVSSLIVDNQNNTTPLKDNSFVSKASPAGNFGLFYISVSSSLARTSLKSNRLILQITINSIIVANLQPELIISPGQMASAAFVSTYVKSNTTLTDGNADTPYVFSTNGFDIYNNPTTCDGNILQLSIMDPNQNRVNFNIGQAGSPGVAIFTLDNKILGLFTIKSGVGFLPQVTFYNSFGSLNNLQSLTNNLSINLIAGSLASFSITPKDQYLNNITPNLALTSISVTVTTPSGKVLSTTSNIMNEQIIFSTTLTEQGINSWQLTINNQATNCLNCITTVSPSAAVPSNSLVSYLDDNGVYTLLSNSNQIITRSNKNPLSISVAFVDAYGNLISSVPNTVSIQNSIIQGDYMTPMTLNVAQSSDNSAMITSVSPSQKDTFGCLVSGSYSFSFTVFSGTQSFVFSFPLQLTSTTNDSGYGNGNYVVEQTQLSNTSINMIAGTTFTINIKLRTAQMLYYHSDINLSSDITSSLSSPDSSFAFTSYKRTTSFGDYNIDIFSTTATQSKTVLKFLIRDPSNPNNFKEIPIPISFSVKPTTPPDNTHTKIVMQPDSTTLSGQSLIIQFQLYDKYGNLYVRNTDIINNNYLLIYQNNNPVTNAVVTLLTDSVTYQLSYIPAYPPRNCAISILYYDSQSQTNVFLTPITTQIISYPVYPNSIVSGSNVNQINAGDKLSVSVQLYDQNSICVDDTDVNIVAQVTGPAEASIPSQKINYSYTFSPVSQASNSNCQTSYMINVPDSKVYALIGTYKIVVLVGDNNYVAQVFTQKVVPNVLDTTKFISTYTMAGNFNPGAIVAGNTISFTVKGNDKYGNQVASSILNSTKIKLINKAGKLLVSDQDNKTNFDYRIQASENQIGLLNIGITIFQANSYYVQYYYQGNLLTVDTSTGPLNISIIPNVCSSSFPNIDLSNLSSASSGTATYFMISCTDNYNNTITRGGEKFAAFITLNILSSMTSSQINSKITDNLDGTYRVDFTPLLAGWYDISLNLGRNPYGNSETVVINDSICSSEMPVRCPNNLSKCVKNITDCLSSSNNPCAMPTPFYCQVNNILTCVSSNTACDCPSGYVKCSVMNVCVPAGKNYMCSFTLPMNCSKRFPKSPVLCYDGICRNNIKNSPSQRVCPLGSVLCGDLTCRSSYSQCAVYNDCPGNMIRCSDQSCVLDQKDCPSTVTCSDATMYACPDGSCVSNELFCKPLPQCSNPNPILCSNNSCLANVAKCPKQVSCGQEKTLCQDLICKSNC